MPEKQLNNEYMQSRLLNQILQLYYVYGLTQLRIAKKLGLSTTKVNRLLQFARRKKMVEVTIHTSFQHLFNLESDLQDNFSLQEAWVTPNAGTETDPGAIGVAGARFLLEHLHDGDIIAIGGGAAIQALVESVHTENKYRVEVVPMVGGIQGQATTDVNYLAAQLAERLGGSAFQLYSPAFVETPAQRDALLQMAPIKEILDIARHATIALLGIGTVDLDYSRYMQFTALSPEEMVKFAQIHCAVGESLAIVYDIDGNLCAPAYTERVVGLTLDELRQIPLRAGVAGTARKSRAIYAALREGHLNYLVTDQAAAEGVMDVYQSRKYAASTIGTVPVATGQAQELAFEAKG